MRPQTPSVTYDTPVNCSLLPEACRAVRGRPGERGGDRSAPQCWPRRDHNSRPEAESLAPMTVHTPDGRADTTRRHILRAASHQFARRAYHDVGLDDILAEAELTKGAMYFHFRSKHALAVAIIERQSASGIVAVEELLARKLSGLETLIDFTYLIAVRGHQEGRGQGRLEPSRIGWLVRRAAGAALRRMDRSPGRGGRAGHRRGRHRSDSAIRRTWGG